MRPIEIPIDKASFGCPGIYAITEIGSGQHYVGSAQDLHRRLLTHRHRLRNGLHANPHLQLSYNKNGEHSFCWEVIERCPVNDLNERELHWINLLDSVKSGFNIRTDPVSNRGLKASEETKAKLRAIQKARYEVPGAREKHSQSAKASGIGSWLNEWRKNNPVWNKGKKMPPEHCRMLSEAHKGIKLSKSHAESVRKRLKENHPRVKGWSIIDPSGNVLKFRDLSKFCRERGLSQPSMWAVATGKRRKHMGWCTTIKK